MIGKSVLIFFMDGVGLGGGDPADNPFVNARLPHLTGLLGGGWFLKEHGRITVGRASLSPTDACLGVPGRPQSATGQATILTGRNVPQLIGHHYGPKPNSAIAAIVKETSLFHEVIAAGGKAALLTPYPQRYFDHWRSGRRLLSSVPLAAVSAGLRLKTADDLRAGGAVSPDFTGQGWRNHLGYSDIPILTLNEAGRRIAALGLSHSFSFFEHWPSDRSGHRGSLEDAIQHLEALDEAIGGLLEGWNDSAGLLIITSDHGNIEEKSHRQHSCNPVPTILVGAGHDRLAASIYNLADIAAVVRTVLALGA